MILAVSRILTSRSPVRSPRPIASGRGTFTLNDPNLSVPSSSHTMLWAPEAFRLIEVDGNGLQAVGSMYGQGAGAFSAATLGSKFVFGQSGIEDYGIRRLCRGRAVYRQRDHGSFRRRR